MCRERYGFDPRRGSLPLILMPDNLPPFIELPPCTVHATPDGVSITCQACGMTSHHPDDVDNLYCGHCHVFHYPRTRDAEFRLVYQFLLRVGSPLVAENLH